MPKSAERGFIHILALLLLLAGIVGGLYLVQHPTSFKPKASNPPIVFKSSTGQALSINSQGIPQTTSLNIKIELTSTLGESIGVGSSVAPPSRVFVTSTGYNGDLGGLSGADQKCQDRANAANLGGTWKAWLSDSNTSATSRLTHSTGPYTLLNGTIVANDWTDLISGNLKSSISWTEQLTRAATYNVWTNTATNGSISMQNISDNCNNWTDSSLSDPSSPRPNNGIVGNTTVWNSIGTWTDGYRTSCSSDSRLYCFEQTSSGGSVSYKIAENPADLTSRPEIPYTTTPTVVDYTFQDSSLGHKFIFVEFKNSAGTTEGKTAQIDLVSSTPTPSLTPSPSPTPTSTLPDLTVTNLYKSFTGSNPPPGTRIIFSTIIKNQGNVNAGTFRARLCLNEPDCFNSQNAVLGSTEIAYLNGLAANTSATERAFGREFYMPNGNVTATMCADGGKLIAESDESNNCKSMDLSPSSPSPTPTATPITANPAPIGFFDSATCTTYAGWTCDASNYNATLDVHFYKDGPAGSGTFIGNTTANGSRPDLITANVCGSTGNHGFNYSVPATLKDGVSHSIYAYAINTPAGTNPQLIGSPKTLTCASTQTPILPPTLSARQLNQSDIQLSWNNSQEASSYKLYQCMGANCTPNNQIATVKKSNTTLSTYNNTGLLCNNLYRYSVKAVDNNGRESNSSNIAQANTAACTRRPLFCIRTYCIYAP